MALPDPLSALLHADAYPHPCERIELIETHISWVILTGDYAYKLKKPVHFNFVDFSTLALREHFCREEVRCNRAFAPALYLDVVAVVAATDGIAVEQNPGADVLEWAVQMRQFDPQAGLDQMLARGELAGDSLRRFGADLAARHALLPSHHGEAREVPVRFFGPVEDNFREIGGTGLADQIPGMLAEALALARSHGEALRPALNARMRGGYVRECHGDLHLSNLALIGGAVTAFDCLEFNENLRWIDTMSDVAFLFMDCHCRGEAELAYQFLDGYLDGSGDYEGACVLHYFAAYRSVVRAKVAALRWVQEQDEALAAKFLEHLGWARDWLRRAPGTLVLTCGLSGSGKSYLAGKLLGVLPAVRLRSDVARKYLAGLGPRDASQSPIDGGLYGREQSRQTYGYLAGLAGKLLMAGEHVIVDATFIESARRQQFVEMAAEKGVSVRILYCDVPESLLRERVSERALTADDPSEATVEVLDLQLSRFEPPTTEAGVISVDMSTPLTDARILGLCSEITAS